MEAVIIHAQREEEANEWKAELEAKYPHVTIRTGYFWCCNWNAFR